MQPDTRRLAETGPIEGAAGRLPRLGAHMSAAGGLENVFHEGIRVGCDCVQMFVKNQRQWNAKALGAEQIARFRATAAQTGLSPVVAHASYLLNLASPDEASRRKSVAALLDEYDRCDALGVSAIVLHPGARLDAEMDVALRNVAASLDEIRQTRLHGATWILVEITAGQGSNVGHSFEQLRDILGSMSHRERVGVCVDTCHLFAAGYDFRGADGYAAMIEALDRAVGLAMVRCLHVNDSKNELGSRVDRHEHIGKGKIGKAGFGHFLNDPRFRDVPMMLETPKGTDGRGADLDQVNLKRLRGLIR